MGRGDSSEIIDTCLGSNGGGLAEPIAKRSVIKSLPFIIIFIIIQTMGSCCAGRDRGTPETDILTPDKRAQFRGDLSRAVDKELLHSEVLAHQHVLNFDSYREIMALVSSYVAELALSHNQSTFAQRQSLLQLKDEGREQYEKLIAEHCQYQARLQSELLA